MLNFIVGNLEGGGGLFAKDDKNNTWKDIFFIEGGEYIWKRDHLFISIFQWDLYDFSMNIKQYFHKFEDYTV